MVNVKGALFYTVLNCFLYFCLKLNSNSRKWDKNACQTMQHQYKFYNTNDSSESFSLLHIPFDEPKLRFALCFCSRLKDCMNCKHSPPPVSKSNVVQFLKTEKQACQRPLLSADLAIHTGDPNPTAKAMKLKGNRTRHSRYRFDRFPILEINTTAEDV